MTAQPFFLVRVSAMFTSDDADSVVPSAEMIVVDGQFDDMGKSIAKLAAYLVDALDDAPLENFRPMTRDEINEYRRAESEESDTEVIYDAAETRQ